MIGISHRISLRTFQLSLWFVDKNKMSLMHLMTPSSSFQVTYLLIYFLNSLHQPLCVTLYANMTHIWEWNGTGRADWEWDELEGSQSPPWSQCPPCYVGHCLNRLSSDLSLTPSLIVLMHSSSLRDGVKNKKSLFLCCRDSLTDLPSLPTATKADGFALYFLGECNNVSVEHI